MVRIHKMVWFRTVYNCCMFMTLLEEQSELTSQSVRRRKHCVLTKPWYLPVRLHGPVIQNTVILNLNILHFTCIVSLFITDKLLACVRQ